jgi:hypothetical protein
MHCISVYYDINTANSLEPEIKVDRLSMFAVPVYILHLYASKKLSCIFIDKMPATVAKVLCHRGCTRLAALAAHKQIETIPFASMPPKEPK